MLEFVARGLSPMAANPLTMRTNDEWADQATEEEAAFMSAHAA